MNEYIVIILAVIGGRYVLEVVTDWLNSRHVGETLPPEFQGYYDAQKYKTSQNYLRENTRFGLLSNTLKTTFTVAFILLGGFNFVDTNIARSFAAPPLVTGLVFAASLMVLSKLLNLPFALYDTFVIEEKYGFNKTTPKVFALDTVKSFLLTLVIGGAVFLLVLWFFRTAGPLAWLYCWAAVVAFQIFMMFVAPYVIMPLFNKFEPLEEGELKSEIENYARKQNFKMKGVFKMDGSKRSTKSNAFFTGFGSSRRIVLFDTLIQKHTVRELVAILAHEMGHYKKKHILSAILRSVAASAVMFFLLSLFIKNERLFEAFGMEHLSVYASLFFFGFLYVPIAFILGIIESAISRRHEYQADAYAVETYGDPEALITGLKKLTVENLSNLTPHPLKVFLSYSHPPVLERIKAIRKAQAAG